MSLTTQPHRRWNALKREWVLVSPQRTQRPWQGQTETPATVAALEYDPACYLCPGNERAGGKRNPPYTSTFVFENDYAALRPTVEPAKEDVDGLLVGETEAGVCRVLCFSPRHDLTLAKMGGGVDSAGGGFVGGAERGAGQPAGDRLCADL